MGVFLKLTFELRSADTRMQNKLIAKSLDYFIDNLNDIYWQEMIGKKIRKNSETQIAIKVFLRFFRQETIKEGKLLSDARYFKKDGCLIIDPVFSLEEYMHLNEDKLREKVCKDIYEH